MPDGKVYDFVKVPGKQWKYVFAAKDIIKGKVGGADNKIAITWIEATVEGRELLEMMCKVYGMSLIKTKTVRFANYNR